MANSRQEPSPKLLKRVTPRGFTFPFSPKKLKANKNGGPTNGLKSHSSPGVDLRSRLSESPSHPATKRSPSNRSLIDRLKVHPPTPTPPPTVASETTSGPTAQPATKLSSTEILATLQNSAALQDMLKLANNTGADTAEMDISNEVLGPSPIILGDKNAEEKVTSLAEEPSPPQIPPSSPTSSVAAVEDQLMLDNSNSNTPVEGSSPQRPAPPATESSILQKCRDLIIPLVLRNAKARDPEIDSEALEKKTKALVTDEVCAKSFSLAKDLKEQLDAKRAQEEMLAKHDSSNVVIGVKRPRGDGDDGSTVKDRPPAATRISALEQTERSISTQSSPGKMPPRAPKAMIEQGRARVMDKFDSMSTSRGGTLSPLKEDGEIISPGSKRLGSRRDFDRDDDGFRSGSHSRRNSRQSDVGIERERDHSRRSSRYGDEPPRRRGSRDDSRGDYSKRTRDTDRDRSASYNQDLPLAQPAHSGYPVPGLWFVRGGLNQIDILDVEFEVHPDTMAQDTVAVHLMCIPKASVEQTLGELDSRASPDTVADALRNTKTEWPSMGKVVMELNSGDTVGRSWLPRDFDSSTPALDVTSHLKSGQNRLRLIHLGDLSSFMFLLHATPTTQTQKNSPDSLGSNLERYLKRLQSDNSFQFTGSVVVEPEAV